MDLKELFGEELAKQVEAKLGDKKIAVVNDGSWLPKAKLDEKLEEIKELKLEISGRDEQLGQLKSAATGNEDLLKQIADLQAVNDTTRTEYEQKIKDTQLSTAIKLALHGKVQDLDIMNTLLDKNVIELDEAGNIVKGLDEQVATLKEAKSFLFVPDATPSEPTEPTPAPKMSVGNPTPGDSKGDAFSSALAKIGL